MAAACNAKHVTAGWRTIYAWPIEGQPTSRVCIAGLKHTCKVRTCEQRKPVLRCVIGLKWLLLRWRAHSIGRAGGDAFVVVRYGRVWVASCSRDMFVGSSIYLFLICVI